jgi:hypothetical protein
MGTATARRVVAPVPEHGGDALIGLERQLADLAAEVRGWTADLKGVPAAVVLAHKLSGEMSEVLARLSLLEDGAAAEPQTRQPRLEFAPQLRWHELDEAGRDQAVARIGEWVDSVYRQQFPRAGDIAPCWADHPVCVVVLDVLSQMHAALYHGTKRSWGLVHNQGELYVRFGREITALVHDELAGCKYGQHTTSPSLTGGGGRG